MPSDVRLRYLYESSRLGTMSAASEKLDVAVSSISRQIAELQKELGMPLIEGGRRRIKLTEAGEAVCLYYKEKTAHKEQLLGKLDEIRSMRRGRIELAIGEAFISDEFSKLLSGFLVRYPGIFIKTKVSESNDSISLVREDEAHFGLVFGTPRDPKIYPRIVFAQPLKVLTHPEHELAKSKVISLADISKYSVALPDRAFRINEIVHEAEHHEDTYLESGMVSNSMRMLKAFARFGEGVTILPEFLAQPELARGQLIAISTDNSFFNATKISLITRRGRQLPKGAYQLMMEVEAFIKNAISVKD